MTHFLIEATIDPAKLAILAAARGEHYEFLIRHRHIIVFGGPARGREDGPPQTMIIVVDAGSLDDARAFIAAEPYNRMGGFTAVTVRPWSQVLPETEPGALERVLANERAAKG